MYVMVKEIQKVIQQAVFDLYSIDLTPQVSIPDEKFGDVSSNVAMQLPRNLVEGGPHVIAEQLAKRIRNNEYVTGCEVAGAGFLNIRVSDRLLLENLNALHSLVRA
jgi:arginyl-tRNA synthetase